MAQDLYHVFIADFVSNTIIDELEWTQLTYSNVLNAPGAFSITIPNYTPSASPALLKKNRRVIYIERNFVIEFGGILYGVEASLGGPVTITGNGLWDYFRHRVIRDTIIRQNVDQLDIARALMLYAQGQGASAGIAAGEAWGNIGVTNIDAIGTNLSGYNRDEYWFGYERKNLAEAIEQLAERQNGFEFVVDCSWATGSRSNVLRRFWARSTLATGGPRAAAQLDAMSLGGDVAGVTVRENGEEWGNRVDATGAGDDEAMLIATAEETAQRDYAGDASGFDRVPLFEKVITYRDVFQQAQLNALAAEHLLCTRWGENVADPSVRGGLLNFATLPYPGHRFHLEGTDPGGYLDIGHSVGGGAAGTPFPTGYTFRVDSREVSTVRETGHEVPKFGLSQVPV